MPLDLGNIDVILGMQWLGSLDNMEVNWKLLEFLNRKRVSYIKRESQAQSYRVSLKTMVKALQQEGRGSGWS